jgi:hypothetical protein
MCWIRSIIWVDFLAVVGASDESSWVAARVVQHPWDPMVEIPTPPENGCSRLNYVWICCSYVEHMEDSHPMC